METITKELIKLINMLIVKVNEIYGYGTVGASTESKPLAHKSTTTETCTGVCAQVAAPTRVAQPSKKTIKSQVFDFIQQSQGPVRRKDIIAWLATNVLHEKYDAHQHRGVWSNIFCPSTWATRTYRRPTKNESRYLVRVGRGLYDVREGSASNITLI